MDDLKPYNDLVNQARAVVAALHASPTSTDEQLADANLKWQIMRADVTRINFSLSPQMWDEKVKQLVQVQLHYERLNTDNRDQYIRTLEDYRIMGQEILQTPEVIKMAFRESERGPSSLK